MKKAKNYVIVAIGVILLIAGLYLAKTMDRPGAFMTALPYVCIGIGCGALGHGMGNIISNKIIQKNPDMQKQMEIEQKDERNEIITNRAKSRAYDVMTFVFGALMIAFALMGVDMIPVLLFVFVYLFVQGYAVYYRCKYEKEM